jgi:hypothetical protein
MNIERNMEDFLDDPQLVERLSALDEQEFYESLGKEIFEAMLSAVDPYKNIEPSKPTSLSRTSAVRDFKYAGKSSQTVRRSDKIKLTSNKDLNIVKQAVASAFNAIIAVSNKTPLVSQITSILKQTEQRIYNKIDSELKKQERTKA